MKNKVKQLVLLIGLSLVLSAFISCSSTRPAESLSDSNEVENGKKAENGKDVNSTKDNQAKSSNDDYPPPPKAIATADFELMNGQNFRVEDKKGKVILINLWAIWCGPCIKEMPHLNEMQEKFKDKDLVILGLNTGDDFGQKEVAANIDKFAKKQNLNYQIGYSARSTTEEFFRLGQMNGIPQSFLIDRNGKLRGIFQGGGPRVILTMKETVEKIVNES